MTEIAKCRCGADAEWQISTDGKVGRWCRRCGIHGPWCDFEELMDAAWNALMRPRPVARWNERVDVQRLSVGDVVLLGNVYREGVGWRAVCLLDGAAFASSDLAAARAWLEARVRAAGFDVQEAKR